MGVIAGLGAAALVGGSLMSASAASRQRRDLRNIANTPPIDIGSVYRDAISSAPINELSDFSTQLNVSSSAELQRLLNESIPGYSDIQSQRSANTLAQLQGELPEDVQRSVYQSSVARALGGGYGGSPAARNLALSDLGLTSLEMQQLGMQNASNLISSTPMIDPVTAGSLMISPQDVLALRTNERAMRMQAQTTAAQAPGRSAVLGQGLTQLGGIGLGAGLANFGGGLGANTGYGSTQSILNRGQQLPAYGGVSYGGAYA
jgi:hypothetical protein